MGSLSPTTPNHVPVHATDDVCPCRLGVVSRHFLEHSTRKKSNASHDTRRHNPLEMLLILERCKFSRFFLMSLQLRFFLKFSKILVQGKRARAAARRRRAGARLVDCLWPVRRSTSDRGQRSHSGGCPAPVEDRPAQLGILFCSR